jgi:hypothetical protein
MAKIKNPDKYIARLKKQNEWLRGRLNMLRDEIANVRGQCQVTWSDGIIDEQGVTGRGFQNFRPGDKVCIIGEITEVTLKMDAGYISFRRIQTKKVQAF